MTPKRWASLMGALGFSENKPTFSELINAYSDKHRFYHTTLHIQSCLGYLDKTKKTAEKPDEIELALWFHDAIYNPHSTDNEFKSAQWATEFLVRNSAPQNVISRVNNLIMVTLHNAPAQSKDEKLLVDIDLSILGAAPDVYEKFEKAIRKEYSWVPELIFRTKRKEILSSFLEKSQIYQNTYFFEKYEKQAMVNLANAISLL